MKWLEVLHVRSTKLDSESLEHFLEQLGNQVESDDKALVMNIFRRANLGTDVCIQLHHETDRIQLSGSGLGIHLSMALKKYGMVNHTVWVEERLSNPE